MTGLPDGWDQSAERIAWYCAKSRRADNPHLTLGQLHDAALDGVLIHVWEHGWPEGQLHPLYQAAWRSIAHEAHEAGKHLRHFAHWCEPPGLADPIGEAITEKPPYGRSHGYSLMASGQPSGRSPRS